MDSSNDFLQRLAAVEPLIERLQQHPDITLRQQVQQLTRMLLELHEQGLSRMLQHLHDQGPAGEAALGRWLDDPLIANLLVLHGVHPTDFHTRLAHGFAAAEEFVASQSASMTVVAATSDSVEIRVSPNCTHCQSATMLCDHVRQLVMSAAPDAGEVLVELSSSDHDQSESLLPIIDL